jgi:hypothetical protein
MRPIFLVPAFSLAVTAVVATYLGWSKEATIIGGLAVAGCLTLVATGIEDTIRGRRRAKEEEQQRGMEHWRRAERQRAPEEITRASPKQPKERAPAVEPKKQRVSAVQPSKSRASAKRPKKEPGRTPS